MVGAVKTHGSDVHSAKSSSIDFHLMRTATDAEFDGALTWIGRIGGCAAPVYLTGRTVTRDAASGRVLNVFSSSSQPHGR